MEYQIVDTDSMATLQPNEACAVDDGNGKTLYYAKAEGREDEGIIGTLVGYTKNGETYWY